MASRKPLVIIGPQIERLPDDDFVILGKLNIGPPPIVTAALTINFVGSNMRVQHLGAGIQNIDTISGGETGDLLFLRRTTDNDVRIRKGPGNIRGGPNRLLDGPFDVITLLRLSGNWVETSWQG